VFVNFFIRRPVFATVCSLLIILAGAVAIPTLPIAQFPQLAPPQVTVSAFYTGANSEAVETSVTTLLEQAINGAEGMRYITSSSTNSGQSSITATFDLDRNLDIAAVDVQNRTSASLGRLPGEVQSTGVTINKNSGSFVLAAGFYAEGDKYEPLFISNYLDVHVVDALKRIKGVGNVMIFGERKYAMRLWLDPLKLAKRGLSAQDVVSALREQNVQVAAGSVGQPPSKQGQQYQISVRVAGRLTDPGEFERIILKTAPGALVQLRDVGRAELGAETYSTNLTFNRHRAMGLGVQQLTNANALDVDKAVKEELLRLSSSFPPGLKYEIAFDTTTAVADSISEVLKTLAEAIIIVILVIFFFLQSWRSTLIPAITIPVSLVGTFAFIKLFGFSINTLTLFGITLATGLVVDDAIVVIENVERHMEEGIAEARRASEVAMGEVTGAVIATSLVLIAVFLPVSLFPGTTGRMYQQFALTIAFSIALSAFNALTLTPALSALLLRPARAKHNPIFGAVNWSLKHGTAGYVRVLHVLERQRVAMVVVFLVGLGLTYVVYRKVPTSFVPDEDMGYFIMNIQAPPGASLEYTSAVADRVSAILMKNSDIVGAFAVPGFSFGGGGPNNALVFVNVRNIDERHGPQHTVEGIVNGLRPQFAAINNAIVIPFLPPAIQGLSAFGGFQFELQQTAGGSLSDMEGVLRKFQAEAGQRPELRGLFSSYTARDPQFLVTMDREKAKSLGIPLSQITSALQVFMASQYVNDFDFNNRSYRVYVQADQLFRAEPRDLREFYVRADSGQMVPLDNIVTVKESTTANAISHYNIFRSAEINGSAAPGYSSGQAIAAMEDVARKTLPGGYGHEWTGLALEEIQSGSQSLVLFGLGLLVVYLTLSAQYESFVLPFIILLAVPMAVLGGLGAQGLRGLNDDVYAQVGLLMLIGLASKNSILIVEFAEQLQDRGMELFEAATEAARLRLRPILMTSFAFILGVLPLVFATGAGSAGRHSVGTTVFGGMIVSTLLNLFIIPILYVIVRGILPRKHHRGGDEEAPVETAF
jgi:HAE1 family hydrophobic/amphiphilic exporter-1